MFQDAALLSPTINLFSNSMCSTLVVWPYIPYQVSISAQNSNPVLGEVNSAIVFSREGSEFVLASKSRCICINLSFSTPWHHAWCVEIFCYVLVYTVYQRTIFMLRLNWELVHQPCIKALSCNYWFVPILFSKVVYTWIGYSSPLRPFSSNSCSKGHADNLYKRHPHEHFLGATNTGRSERLHWFHHYYFYTNFLWITMQEESGCECSSAW